MSRVEELIDYLKSGDVSRLQRWDGIAYEEFCNAVDDYADGKDYDDWMNLLEAVAQMIEGATRPKN